MVKVMIPLPIKRAAAVFLRLIGAMLIVIAIGTAPARAEEKRIALVIGNADYEQGNTLTNPVNDARLIRQTLESLNFEVVYRENVSKTDMERAISVFADKLYNAGSSGVALFYYAGHGLQSNGENFLLPVDISVARESDLRFAAVRASDVLAQMEAAQSMVKIVILDACRDNPFTTKFGSGRGGRGLAEIGLGSSEFFIAYAATSGNVADDNYGDSRNSPYAAALARRLATPGSEISNTFRLIRIDVSAATSQRQLPEARTTMRREFYFTGAPPRRAMEEAAVTAAPQLAMLVPKASDIVGTWCEAGRGRGVLLGIDRDALTYSFGGQKTRYNVVDIKELSDAKIQVAWFNRGEKVVFEFGDFDSKGMMMTQLRGRQGDASDWKEYNLRFRKCPARK
jgi:hypothetical protein